ncbi:MAG: hypothetical protein HOP15_00685 [Planctomycetes bacterium]|nr:hypothetical protein [Planctomycetota bacterium]
MSPAVAWNRRATLVLVLLVAACALSLAWFVHPWYEANGQTNDASVYLLCAKSMLAGDGYSYLGQPFVLRPPGFPTLLLPLLAWRGLDFHALNLFVAAFGVLAVACVFAYHHGRLGPLLAFALAASLWLNPGFERFCNRVMSDMPGTALLFVGLLLERWAGRRPSAGRDVLVGVFVGLSAYVRAVNVLLAPAIVCARLCARWRAGERQGWLAFVRQRCLAPLVVPLLVLLPWSLRNANNRPQLPVDQTFVHSYSVALLHSDPSDPSSPVLSLSELLERVGHNLVVIVTTLGKRMSDDATTATSWIVGALVAFGALAAALRHREVDSFVLLGLLATVSISLEVIGRYALPLYVFALPSAVDTLRRTLARGIGEGPARASLALALALVTASDLDPRRGWDGLRERHESLRAASVTLTAAVGPDARLAASLGWHYSIYLDRPVYSLVPSARHKRGQHPVEDVIDRRGIDTVFFDPERLLDEPFVRLFRERYGEPQRAGHLEFWRVRP